MGCGHQCYAHKILTGRGAVQTIDVIAGLAVFLKDESPYDVFAGHSSIRFLQPWAGSGRDLQRKIFRCMCNQGRRINRSMPEALNYTGDIKTDLIVVLNDNEMSIDQNVGGVHSYLARLRTDPKYFRLKEDLEQLLERIPAIGRTMLRSAERLKDSVKYLLVPGMLFEELGFTYLGPVNGHNIPGMLALFREARGVKGPILIHAVTKKGKGYVYAEKDPHFFHGVGPFDKDTGKLLKANSTATSYSQVFGHAMEEFAAGDAEIVTITAAMTSGTGLEGFSNRWPERFFDVGIAEQHAVQWRGLCC